MRMFNEHISPNEVLKFTYDSMKSVITRMVDLGFPPDLTPSHTSSVYLVTYPEDENKIGLGRSEPTVLSKFPREQWGSIGIFNLEGEITDTHIPVGCFFGFIVDTNNEHSSVLKSRTDSQKSRIFVGILTCPKGQESVGCYAPISEIENPTFYKQDPLTLDDFGFLQTDYISDLDIESQTH
jgi:hypothetical protein